MMQLDGDVLGEVAESLKKVKELALQLAITKLDHDNGLEDTLDAVSDSLLKVKNLSENGYRFLRLIDLLYDLSRILSDSSAIVLVKRTILPALYFYESSLIDEIQNLDHLESEYVPPELPIHEESAPIPTEQDEKNSHNSVSDLDTDSSDEGDDSLPPMTQPYQKRENLFKTLRSIRQYLICFEVRAILSEPFDNINLPSRIARLVAFLVLEHAHRLNILPNLTSSVEPSEFHYFVNQAFLIVCKKLEGSKQESTVNEKERNKEVQNTKEHSEVDDIELDTMKEGSEESGIIELNMVLLHGGHEFLSVAIPVEVFKADRISRDSLDLFYNWTPPSSLAKIWTKRISSTLEGLDDSSNALAHAARKIYEYEKPGKLARWADVSRMKDKLIVFPLLKKSLNSHSFLIDDIEELKRAYFVNGMVGGIWTSFWAIVFLFTLLIVFLQIVFAKSFLSLITVWNSKEKYAITAILYESANSDKVMISVYCISLLPLIWGIYKGIKSMLSITNDPKEEFHEALGRLKSYAESVEVSGWFVRVIWWDRLRWKLPFYDLRNTLELLMELARWDARISAADRFDYLSVLILLYQSRGGETRSVVSGYIAEYVDIMRADENMYKLDSEDYKAASLISVHHENSYEETQIIRATKVRSIEFLLSMGEFPVHEWRHAKWYARPLLLWHYLEGRHRNWWIGLSSSLFEFVFFFFLTIMLIAMSLLFVSTALEAIREYAACPQMKGITFAGPAPYVGKFDSECWTATMEEFGRIPGQPPETLISVLPKFYFSKETRRSFTLDISGKYLDGDQIGKLIDGFRESGFTITRLIAKQNSIGTLTILKPGYLSTFAKSLEKLSSSLVVLDLSECGLGDGSYSFASGASEWQHFYDVLGGMSALKTLNIAGNSLGRGLYHTNSDTGEKLSTLFSNSVSKLTGLEELDLSDNFLSSCDEYKRPFICLDIGTAIKSIHSLKNLNLKNNDFVLAADGTRGMIDSIDNPELTHLDLSENLLYSMDLKHSILSLLSRHKMIKHLDLPGTLFFYNIDIDNDDFAQRFNDSIRALAGSLKFLNLSSSYLFGTDTNESFLVNALNSFRTLEKLETLDLSNNGIGYHATSDEVSLAFENMLSGLRSLRKLNVHENFLGFKLWNVVSEHLKIHPQLETSRYLILTEEIEEYVRSSIQDSRLTLKDRLLTGFARDTGTFEETSGIYHRIFNAIAKQSKPLTSLDISRVGLDLYNPADLALVGEGLETIALSGKRLQELSLADNYISSCSNVDALVSLMKGILAHSSSLKHLDLSGNGGYVSLAFAYMLKDLFLGLTELESLNLSGIFFGDEQITYEYIGDGIVNLQSLKKLGLENIFLFEMNEKGAVHLFNSISKLTNLRELYANDLYFELNPKVLPSFSSIFSIPSLRGLYLKGSLSAIGSGNRDEVLNFLEDMKQAKNLRVLDLADNNLAIDSVVESKAIDTIKSFENLCTLYLNGNSFGFYYGSKGLGDLMYLLPRLVGHNVRGAAGVDWSVHATSIYEATARDLRSKCENRVCRGSKVATEPPICPI